VQAAAQIAHEDVASPDHRCAASLLGAMHGPVAAREMAAASSLSIVDTLLVPARRASCSSRRGLPRHSRSLRAHTYALCNAAALASSAAAPTTIRCMLYALDRCANG
jgi:hypothetical protein